MSTNTTNTNTDLSSIKTLSELDAYLSANVPSVKSDSRRFVGDIIVEAIDANVAMTFQELSSHMSMYTRGSLRGSATSTNSLDRYIKELLTQGRLFKPARNLYIVNKQEWTEGELLQIVSKVYHQDALASVKVYGEDGKHCDVDVELEVGTYVKDFVMPSNVNVRVWVKCKSVMLRRYYQEYVLIPAMAQIDGSVYQYDVDDVLKAWEYKARNAIQEDGEQARLPCINVDESGNVVIKEYTMVEWYNDDNV